MHIHHIHLHFRIEPFIRSFILPSARTPLVRRCTFRLSTCRSWCGWVSFLWQTNRFLTSRRIPSYPSFSSPPMVNSAISPITRRHSSTGEWKTRSKCFPSKGGKRTDPTPTMGNEREARSNACRSLHDFPAHEMGWDGRNKAIEHVWPIYASCAIDPTLPNQWASAFMAIETLGKG